MLLAGVHNTALSRQVLATCMILLCTVSAAHAGGDKTRGAYLARIMDCGGCHTPGAIAGKPNEQEPLSGSEVGFAIPELGVFYPPNLTPDKDTGLGKWSEADILRALRKGVRPDGRELAPIMPWRSFAALTDEDAGDLAAYLKSLPASVRKVPGPFGPGEKPTGPYLALIMPAAVK
ncbi:MAG: c-type cytochrome [Rhodomicrobiaceae bacterium]